MRGEVQSSVKSVSPLLRTLTEIIHRKDPNVIPEDINFAYETIFGSAAKSEQQRKVLEVIAASFEPLCLFHLKAMNMLESVRSLPGYGELFVEREFKLQLLHRSFFDWLQDPMHGAIDARSGHKLLAEHIWETVLRPWLLPTSSLPRKKCFETFKDSYSLKYALDHLREAGRFEDIRDIALSEIEEGFFKQLRKESKLLLDKEGISIVSHAAINDNAFGVIDRLGYKFYAAAIVKVLRSATSPLCVGIYSRLT